MSKSLFFLIVLLCSCGGSTGSSSEPVRELITGGTYEEKIQFPFNLPKAKKGDDVAGIRSRFKKVVDLRRNNLTSDLFDLTYNFITPHGFANLRKRKGAASFRGQWVKFEKDFTFRYGMYDKLIGGGLYHYSDQDGFLMLLDDDEKVEPRLFSIQYNSEFYNFIGRPIMFIDDGNGENLLLANWSSDGFLEKVKINHRVENGMQIMMKLIDEKPTSPVKLRYLRSYQFF